jgi:hypothetical protein
MLPQNPTKYILKLLVGSIRCYAELIHKAHNLKTNDDLEDHEGDSQEKVAVKRKE